MKINPILYGVIVTVVFFGIIGGFQAAGFWSTSGKTNADGQAIQPAADDVNSIKGWMTLDQITTAYAVPLDELLAVFNLPADTDPQTAIKDLETDTFSVTELRTWLLNRSSQPASNVSGGVSVPTLDISDPTDTNTGEVPSPTLEPTLEPVAEQPTTTPTEHVAEIGTITGKTTYQELIEWGLPQSTIEEIIGGPMPDGGIAIKDDAVARGMAFSDVKTALQTALDQIK